MTFIYFKEIKVYEGDKYIQGITKVRKRKGALREMCCQLVY